MNDDKIIQEEQSSNINEPNEEIVEQISEEQSNNTSKYTKYDKKISNIIYKLDDYVNTLIRFCFIIMLLIGVYFIVDTVQIYTIADQAKLVKYKPEVINEEALQEISGNCIAWITIFDTTIDYPIMQSTNNIEYLNKDPYGNYSLSGSIFLDARNNSYFDDYYSIVYGHHMQGGFMFGALDDFRDINFFNNHLIGTLAIGDNSYDFHIYAFLVCDADEMKIFDTNGEGKLEYINENAINLINNTNLEGKNIIALTTCKDPGTTERTILVGYISK